MLCNLFVLLLSNVVLLLQNFYKDIEKEELYIRYCHCSSWRCVVLYSGSELTVAVDTEQRCCPVTSYQLGLLSDSKDQHVYMYM